MTKKTEPENHLSETKAKWFAIYTRYKREKLVAKELSKKGIECYLPLQKLLRQWERKKRIVELPLFNCYVFVKITKHEYVSVLETENVLKFVHFSRNLISIPSKEIQIIRQILREELPVAIEEINYKIGDEVEVISGNLLGLKGKLLQIQGKNNLLVDLQTIGFALQMEIDRTLLQKINNTDLAILSK